MSGQYNIIKYIPIGLRPFGLCYINYSRKLPKVFVSLTDVSSFEYTLPRKGPSILFNIKNRPMRENFCFEESIKKRILITQ